VLKRIRFFITALFRRNRFENTMGDEIRFHMDAYTDDLVRTGIPLEQAKRRARLEFGGVETVKEECREARRLNLIDRGRGDVRHAFRTFIKNPGFTAIVLLTLALGMGSMIAIFSVVYGVLLKPLPFPDPERLVQVWGSMPSRNLTNISFTEANFWDFRDLNQSFEEFGAWHGASFTLTGFDVPERLRGAHVSVGFFRSLGVKPVAGRLFNPGEDDPGAASGPLGALLSHAFWVRRFGADRSVIGRRLTLDGQSYEVVGVLPPGTPWLDRADVFAPFVRRLNADRTSWEFTVIGRLKAGMTFEGALSDVNRVARDLEARYPENKNLDASLQRSDVWFGGDQVRRTLWILLGAAGILLAIACVNVTNLLLAHASSRKRESAMRIALGARRGDLTRERMTESLMLSFAGSGLGLLFAYALMRVFRSMQIVGVPRLAEVEIDSWILVFGVAVSVVVGLVTGIAPVWRAPVAGLLTVLQQGQRGSIGEWNRDRMRRVLVGIEVALSLILLVGTGLLVRSLTQVLAVDRGFQTERLLFAMVSIPGNYSTERRTQIVTDILTQLDNRSEIAAVSAVSGLPLDRGSTGMGIAAADINIPDDQVPWASWRRITKDYFKTMGLTLLEGRDFNEQDLPTGPNRVIISKRLATLLWPGRNAVGRTAILWRGQNQRQGEVIGVVSDMRERGLESDPTLAVYLPAYGGLAATTLRLAMQTRGDPEQFTSTLRSIIRGIDPTLPLSEVRTLDEVVQSSLAMRRFTMILLFTFAGIALMLGLAGVYGIVKYSLARRTSEIGLRLALGARPDAVLRLVMKQGLYPIAVGIAAGLFAMYWVAGLMRGLLFGVEPLDPLTYAAMVLLLAAVSLVACYLPARRALRIDPAVALRVE
jgi:putative ABC transport system permease protein